MRNGGGSQTQAGIEDRDDDGDSHASHLHQVTDSRTFACYVRVECRSRALMFVDKLLQFMR